MPTLRRNTNEPACSRDGHAEVIATNHGHVLQVVIPKLFWDFFFFFIFSVFGLPPTHIGFVVGRHVDLGCVAVCCRVLPCVAVCCRVLPCVAVCCRVLEHTRICFVIFLFRFRFFGGEF